MVRKDRLVTALTALWVSLLCMWSLLAPLYDAPDEPQHVDMVLDAWAQLTWPGPTEKVYQPGWLDGLVELRFATTPGTLDPARDAVGADDLPQERRSWEELAAVGIPTDSLRNQMAQHPPLYYRLARALLAMVPGWGDIPFHWVVQGLRLLSVLLAAPLPLLVVRLAARAGLRRTGQALAGIALLGLPTLAHLSSVVTNDVLLTTAAAAGVLGSISLISTGRSISLISTGRRGEGIDGTDPGAAPVPMRVALGTGLAVAVAMLTKAFGLLLVPGVLLAAAHLIRCHGWRATRGCVLAALAPIALAGTWYLENLVRYGELQPQGFPIVPVAGIDTPLRAFGEEVARGLAVRFWGSAGWFEVQIATGPAIGLTAVVVLLALLGVVALRDRPLTVVILLLPLVLVAAVVIGGALVRYQATGELRGIQGRYLFLGVPGLAVVVAAAVQRMVRRLPRTGLLLALAVALGGHLAFAGMVLRTYWEGDGIGARLASLSAWAAPGRVGAAVIGVTVLTSSGWLARELATGNVTAGTSPPHDAEPSDRAIGASTPT